MRATDKTITDHLIRKSKIMPPRNQKISGKRIDLMLDRNRAWPRSFLLIALYVSMSQLRLFVLI